MCSVFLVAIVFFFFSSRRRHTRCREVSWARRCVQETGHDRIKGSIHAPLLPKFLKAAPETCGKPCGIGRTESGGFVYLGTHHGSSEDIRLHLHEEIILDSSAVHLKSCEGNSGIRIHGPLNIPSLVADALKSGPNLSLIHI
eukprot:TRINITY_DN30802_c0_g1_i1.p3 TRINITY_DN30802_c0_g1~~TRINITY_DN30802_c0_g1_i1.p3  ORF type:complete len:142 (-),score=39.45 TRINITY_DN30802_c0_g1_i1:137-562(-)